MTAYQNDYEFFHDSAGLIEVGTNLRELRDVFLTIWGEAIECDHGTAIITAAPDTLRILAGQATVIAQSGSARS